MNRIIFTLLIFSLGLQNMKAEKTANNSMKSYTGITPARYNFFNTINDKVIGVGKVKCKRLQGKFYIKYGNSPKAFAKFLPRQEKFWDLSDFVAIVAKIKNLGKQSIVLRSNILGGYWSGQTAVYIDPGKTEKMFLLITRNKIGNKDLRKEMGKMWGKPGGYLWGWQKLDPRKIKGFQIEELDSKAEGAYIQVYDIHAYGIYGVDQIEYEALCPFVDQYGQYRHYEWPDKIHCDEDLRKEFEREKKDLAKYNIPKNRSKFGGWLNGPKLKGKGNFRVAKHKGKWFFVDPLGYLFWSYGINFVTIDAGANASGIFRKFYTYMPSGSSWELPDGRARIKFGQANCIKKYGSIDKYYNFVIKRLTSWGFNTLGGWSQRRLYLSRKIPYTLVINSTSLNNRELGKLLNRNPEKFRHELRKRLEYNKKLYGQDPWCVGWFIDNEIRWSYGVDAQKYYKIVSSEMKRVAPKILYLGSRFFNTALPYGADEKTARAAAEYCDVIGINRYRYTPNSILLPEGIDKPVIIGEFSFGALDAGMLHPGSSPVSCQEQRVKAYMHYFRQAIKHPNIIGAHWYTYFSQSLTGRWNGANKQIGFVDSCDTPYPGMVETSRKIARELYKQRASE